MGTKFLQGRPFSDLEEVKGTMVVIIDKNAVRTLYGSDTAQAVGNTITIGNDQYSIIGVVESDGSMSMGESTVNAFLPFSTMSTRVTGDQSIGQILGFAREGSDMEALVTKTKSYLVKAFNIPETQQEDSIYVYSVQSMIDSVNATMGAFSLLMTVVASVSLVVGGIGIMNMMLTNVTERIREIGLRKALGARRSDITRQFMLESVCLCLAGGLIGVVLGYLGAFALTGLASGALVGEGMSVTPYIDGGTVLMATTICVVTGVVFGWYPARRAARLDPVESLHYQ
jgi:putative ABC transport system permease protein